MPLKPPIKDKRGVPIVVAQAPAQTSEESAPVAAKGADKARKRVLLSGMERINVGTEQRLIVGVNRFVSFFDGEALVGAGKPAGSPEKIQSAFGAEAIPRRFRMSYQLIL